MHQNETPTYTYMMIRVNKLKECVILLECKMRNCKIETLEIIAETSVELSSILYFCEPSSDPSASEDDWGGAM